MPQPLSAVWRRRPHPCSHTKLVTLKPKYIIENQTGLPMAVKQLNSVDPLPVGAVELTQRFACVLLPNQRWVGGRAGGRAGGWD